MSSEVPSSSGSSMWPTVQLIRFFFPFRKSSRNGSVIQITVRWGVKSFGSHLPSNSCYELLTSKVVGRF